MNYEDILREKGYRFIAGIDEAGRGPLAGPVVAAAVILHENISIPDIDDSKRLSEKMRERLFDIIKREALSIGIGVVSEKVIDNINILQATRKAMLTSVSKMNKRPDYLLIDGIHTIDSEIMQSAIIRGDSLCRSISAASIIAKVTRDRILYKYSKRFPQYMFAKHKGYGTKEHLNLIRLHGPCDIHRKSFKGVKEYL
ncbi:MAG: ribonuclease HII [Nitrospinae bacterium]|nr:ribonuclease HII [Nitrospinota bacterium]